MHAIILAGGKGERLRPLTDTRPKGMVEIGGRPILEFQIAWLRHHGVLNVTISCGYLASVIEAHFGDGSKFGVAIDYIIEEHPLGRGGALRYAMSAFSTNEPIVATNGDNITNLDIGMMVERHRSKDALATVALAPLTSPYGLADLGEGDFISGFREKPALPYWLNAGIYVLDPGIRELLPEEGDHEESTFPRLAEGQKLLGFKIDGFWRTADTVKDVTELTRELEALELDKFLARQT
jgi:NDP-sugar pyrophosphorylase family protein